MAEFPRVHWKTIDGKEVPFVEPQHFSGEGDEVVRTGDKNPLPTKDSEVLTALQSIKEENEEIKQTQSEILERLDGEFDTRLTGSNVELIDVWKDFRCSPGTNTTLDVVDVSDYKYLFIHYTPNGLEDYDLRVTLQRLDRDASLVREDVEKRTSRSNGSTDRFTVNSIKMSVVVYNKTDSDHIFGEIALGGVVG